MAKDLLLEIGLEEMPAHVVTPSRIQLEEKVIKFLDEHHLDYETVQSFATPRRLAVKVTAIPEKQADVEEEVKGPAKKIGQKLHKVLYAAKELQLRTLFSKN